MKKSIAVVLLVAAAFAFSGVAFADNDSSFLKGLKGLRKNLSLTNANAPCVQAAILEHENAVIQAYQTYHAAILAALGVRRDGLVAAWGILDPETRKDALKAVHKTFRDSMREARQTFKEGRKAAHEEFRDDLQACQPSVLNTNSDNDD